MHSARIYEDQLELKLNVIQQIEANRNVHFIYCIGSWGGQQGWAYTKQNSFIGHRVLYEERTRCKVMPSILAVQFNSLAAKS